MDSTQGSKTQHSIWPQTLSWETKMDWPITVAILPENHSFSVKISVSSVSQNTIKGPQDIEKLFSVHERLFLKKDCKE